eukprot:TRINITY_DN5034_c0_g1_i1.p1 TRINITY_DN5034_c0_g1~~TRINITY_DN5034_c0_g1_i1.p1  ORF type:complete len:373 (-),score=51.14 TRINITY_DN5034_c0_g1_i1:361-1479(-)
MATLQIPHAVSNGGTPSHDKKEPLSTLPEPQIPSHVVSNGETPSHEKKEPVSTLPKEVHGPNEELSNEEKELLSILPKGKGWRTPHLYQCEGFWYPFDLLRGIVSCKKHFEACDSDIFFVSTPKAGTIWLKALGFSIVNRASYSFPEHPLLTINPHTLIPFLETQYMDPNHIPDLASLPAPRLLGTHIPYPSLLGSMKDSNCRIVYICRDPKDTFVSLWHFMNKMKPKNVESPSLEECFELFCSGVSEFGPIWEHALGYWKESLERPQKVFFFKYEDMMNDSKNQLKRMAEFLGYPFSKEEEAEGALDKILKLCSFEKLSNLETKKVYPKFENHIFFRKGKVGDWVNFLTPQMTERLDQVMKEKLGDSGLAF